STVDSGNLAACLLTCEQALWELKCDSLAKKAGELARNMDFRCLYNEQRAQFHIGYDAESNELSKSWYDLLASEARLTTLVAIALGQVKTKAYYSLSRLLVPTDGGRALISWSGTMFEYLMPMLFTGAVKGTLIYETAHAAVKTQIGYNRDVWGISESGYHAFDRQLYYQYRAFGIPKLSLMPTHEKEIVISPYSSALALMVKKEQAAANLYKLSKMGMLAKYGMYEAIDFSPSRIGGETGEKVCSFMAHHQGMTLCAINNVLNKENITTRFLRVPEIRAIKLLSEEKRPSMAIMIREFESSVYKNESKNTENEYKPRTVAWNKENSANSRTAQTQLLSNGTYNVLIGDDGGGYSKCHDVMLSRYRKEAEKGRNGVHFCMRHDNKVFSMSSADECIPDSGEIVLEPQGVKFSRRDGALSSRLEVCVSPNHNAEIRRLMIANHGNEDAEIEIGVFFDVCLASQAEDLSHSAFVKVRTDAEKEDGTLLFFRRSKSGNDDDGRFMHCSVVTDADDAKIRYCTDRLIMPGRGKSEKEALMTPFLQDKEIKSPVEVGFCARLTLNVKAEEAKNVSFVMGFANSRKQALSDAAELKGDVNNIISQAWTYTKNALRFEGVTKGKADMFERAVSCMLAHKAHKPHETVDCSGGVNELWRMGISGDKPIILMYVSKITQSRMVKTLLELISYMTARGVEADLVLVGEYPHEYRNELKRRIEELISAYARLSSNVYLLHGYNLSDDDKMLLRAFATIEIESSRSLDKQFVLTDDDGEENMSARKIYPMYGRTRGSFVNRRKELLFDNGFGGFDGKTKEYVIYKDGDSMTPMPWCNILANERFGSIVSEKGGGFTWNGNSREHKLTSADNDPIYDRSSEYILISDNENGRVWNLCSYNKGNEVRHGIGYTRFISQEEETDAELCVFVDSEKSVKYSVLTLTNPMMHKRCLSIMYNVEWCLGEKLNTESVQTEFDNGILFARSFRNSADSGFAYIAIPRMSVEYTGDKAHIKGGAVHAEHLNSKVGLGLGGVGALRTDITLDAGETKTIVFLLGEDSKENAHELYRKCNVEYIEERRRLLAQAWDERLGVFRVKTPDTATNIALNYLLLYQLYSSRLLGRTGYYQCGGATGYRDQLQDMLALKMTAPEKLRAHIVKCASKQFEAGDVLHWWHEPSRGIRTRCSDDKMFLPYAVCEYIETTHDASVLDEEVSFLADMPLGDRENLYCHMADSDVKASVYEHCVRAINNACTSGSHSLPLIGGCDWNDGMDELGKDGGESVWLAMFIVYVLERFIKIAHMRRDEENAERFSKTAQELRKAIEKDGWDGAWYRRAYLGDGTPLGSHINDECSIDLLSQSWAVFCDAVHAREAFDSAQAMLIDEENGIIKLLAPPFDDSKVRVGYIEEYLPGVRENGGQYTHAAAWLVIAACKLGLKNEANRFFS
ncbi:MAG: hypothetical protein IJO48_04190, partial [Clostridia bacterium]|nr:hypothetical protein [Clostridia bacterium]